MIRPTPRVSDTRITRMSTWVLIVVTATASYLLSLVVRVLTSREKKIEYQIDKERSRRLPGIGMEEPAFVGVSGPLDCCAFRFEGAVLRGRSVPRLKRVGCCERMGGRVGQGRCCGAR